MFFSSVVNLVASGFLSIALAAGASANELGDQSSDGPSFPEGSSFGIVPFEGSEEAAGFTGFIDPNDSTSVTISELPLNGWEDSVDVFQDREMLAAQGIIAEQISDVVVSDMPGIRISGRQRLQGRLIPKCIYLLKGERHIGLFAAQIPSPERESEDACRLISGIAVRPPLTLDDQFAALPFSLNNLGEFRLVRVMGGSAAILTIGDLDVVRELEQPVVIVTSSHAPSVAGTDPSEVSLHLLASLARYDIEEFISLDSEEVAGLPGTRLVASAIHEENGLEAMLVQYVAFAPDGNYTRLIGIVLRENWEHTSDKFDSIAKGLSLTQAATR